MCVFTVMSIAIVKREPALDVRISSRPAVSEIQNLSELVIGHDTILKLRYDRAF